MNHSLQTARVECGLARIDALEMNDVTVYREMPATRDPVFKTWFYQRWGRESAVISARTHRAEYPEYPQLLSIKAAFGGSEDYFIDGRRLSVDDDTFAILNHHRTYGSVIDSLVPMHSFSIFFDTRLVAQVNQLIVHGPERALDESADERCSTTEFPETLYAHDRLVSPVLRYIRDAVDAGMDDANWLNEQFLFLLERMFRVRHNRLNLEKTIPSTKTSTRRELLKRIEYGVNFIHTRYRDTISLGDIAAAAHMSQFHFLRTFKAVYHVTPMQFLNHKRVMAAKRFLEHSEWSMSTIAAHVGLGSRTSLFRQISSAYGMSPRNLRSLATEYPRQPSPAARIKA